MTYFSGKIYALVWLLIFERGFDMLRRLFFGIAAALPIAMMASGEAVADSAITVSGYGLDLAAPYGYQDIVYSGAERHVATVDSGWYSVPAGLGYDGDYPALYYGYGMVDDQTGVARVKAAGQGNAWDSSTPWRYVFTESYQHGYFALGSSRIPAPDSADPAESAVFSTSLALEGSFSGNNPATASAFLRVCRLETAVDPCHSDFGFLHIGGDTSTNVSLLLEGMVGDVFELTSIVTVAADVNYGGILPSYSEADFSHTSRLSFVLPTGFTMQGQGGFLASVPIAYDVPEPEPLALIVVGLGLLRVVSRRRWWTDRTDQSAKVSRPT